MKSKSNLNLPRLLLLVTLCLLVVARAIPNLPVTKPTLWILADLSRSASYLALAGYLLSITPYQPLRTKCIIAAVFGWAAVDLSTCLLWYGFGLGGYWFVNAAQVIGVAIGAAFYWFRSYHSPSAMPEPGHIYCLRHRPKSPQDLLLALLGLFGPYGGYAIYCDGKVYQFRHGIMTSAPFVTSHYVEYHCTKGAPVTGCHAAQLNGMVGWRWHWFGANCITLLGRFWAKHGRKDTPTTR